MIGLARFWKQAGWADPARIAASLGLFAGAAANAEHAPDLSLFCLDGPRARPRRGWRAYRSRSGLPVLFCGWLNDKAETAAREAFYLGALKPMDALFNVSGLPQTFPGEDVVTVNFLGIRLWTETWLPKIRKGGAIVTVSSLAGMAYLTRQPLLREFMGLTDFCAARAWYNANVERAGDPYTLSKEAINTWTQQLSPRLMERDIRINCTMPSPIDTPMLNDFRKVAGDAVLEAFAKAKGRFSSLPLAGAWTKGQYYKYGYYFCMRRCNGKSFRRELVEEKAIKQLELTSPTERAM